MVVLIVAPGRCCPAGSSLLSAAPARCVVRIYGGLPPQAEEEGGVPDAGLCMQLHGHGIREACDWMCN